MATVTVTKQFKEDFDLWADNAIECGEFTKEDMADFKEMLRKDFKPGEDQLREGYKAINAAGVTVPAAIDNYEDRIKVWSSFFADAANNLRNVRKLNLKVAA